MITPGFKAWACSLSGCDGGDLSARIWVSGIEWGVAKDEEATYYGSELPDKIATGSCSGMANTYDWQKSIKYTYGRSLAKLYCATQGKKVTDYKAEVEYFNGTELLKLNLYPVAFNSTDPALWAQYGLDKITGFSEKSLFQTWCFYNRFPAIAELVREHKPRIVIGTGVSYLREFFAFFGGGKGTVSLIRTGYLRTGTTRRKYYFASLFPNTILFVIPFFSGSNGLNSHKLLQEMGDILAGGLANDK